MMVPSSCMLIWNPPSPENMHTVRSGAPKVAPMAAGNPKPMVPSPPLVTTERFLLYLKYRHENIWFCPTSLTSTASPLVASATLLTTSPMSNGPSAGCMAGLITLSTSCWWYSAKLSLHSRWLFFFSSRVMAGSDTLQSATTATSTGMHLLISERSMSRCMIFACLA